MQMTFRWYGRDDRIPLGHIRQIPGVEGIVSALHDVPVGEVWTSGRMQQLQDEVTTAGLRVAVVESIPVHEDIKLGKPERERWIDAYCASITAVAAANVPVVCYNFMPIFDWMRTDLAAVEPDGSTTLAFENAALARIDLSRGTGDLPGWATAYDASALTTLREEWSRLDVEALWENLGYFLERVIPVATSVGVKMAIHPDDPPWSIFGLPRIITGVVALRRVLALVDAPANGLTFCTGSLGSSAQNDLPAMVDEFSARGRIHFMHCRNVKRSGDFDFREVPHPSRFGDVDMRAVLAALKANGFAGPMRPDHGRMIWDEQGKPGYGLFDRALGATYLQGIWEGISRER